MGILPVDEEDFDNGARAELFRGAVAGVGDTGLFNESEDCGGGL